MNARIFKKPPLDSVHRAFLLVKHLGAGAHVSVGEAAKLLEVAPSTAHRLLNALCYDGFAVQGEDRTYQAGPACSFMLQPTKVEKLRKVAFEPMLKLSRTVNETVQLWELQGDRVQFLDGIEGTQSLSVRANVWDNSPAAASAAGRAMLAHLPEGEVKKMYGTGKPEWGYSRASTYSELILLLEKVRLHGFAVSVEEIVTGVNGVARCILDPLGNPIAALSIAIPTARFSPEITRNHSNDLTLATRSIQLALH